MASGVHHPLECRGAPASERCQWERIFRGLTEMLQQRQGLVETLAEDRKLLQEHLLLQHARWESETRDLESHIAMLKKFVKIERRACAAKADLMVALKHVEISRLVEEFERAESDVQDFYECVEDQNREISRLKAESKMRSGSASKEQRNWKQEYKELSTKKEAEISALLAEKDFVWHQFKKMEGEYSGIIKSKQIELNQADEAVKKLHATAEKLQSLVTGKEETISSLREALSGNEEAKKLRLLVREKDETIAKLQRELARSEAISRRSSSKMYKCSKDMSSSRRSDLGQRAHSKRKSVVSMPALDSPKLFSSSFKVPKLRHPSPARL